MKKIYLISGVPCCLKTTFGDWLRDQRGFVHIDVESRAFARSPFHAIWSHTLPFNISAMVRALNDLHPRVVLTWGYDTAFFKHVPRLQNAGIDCWWFHSDIEQAHRNWTGRQGHEPEGVFKSHFDNLRVLHPEILSVYGSRAMQTLSPDGRYMALEDIARVLDVPPYP